MAAPAAPPFPPPPAPPTITPTTKATAANQNLSPRDAQILFVQSLVILSFSILASLSVLLAILYRCVGGRCSGGHLPPSLLPLPPSLPPSLPPFTFSPSTLTHLSSLPPSLSITENTTGADSDTTQNADGGIGRSASSLILP